MIVLNDLGSVFSVSGGSFSSPYYQFTDGNGQAVDFSSFLFNRGEIYEFKATGISNSHPFMIGESNGDTSSPLVSGGPLASNTGSIFLTIPSNFSGTLYYFCTAHSSMVAPLTINTGNQAPTNLAPLTSLTITENEVQGTIVGTFQAQDPDGDALTYNLGVDSAMEQLDVYHGDEWHAETAMEFDYESYQTLSIRVKAVDPSNESVEGSFTVDQ